ncbi:hypothetical protein OUZ56_027381 [Daphnia magna]|uniref:Uncharacterized protein n=1 Tax=Daphnia magna TaxID=35525 RepID=A0ABQ9ZPL2_9CRUS|nr:hypothetical protein OUZ56_027381 [Daphnia magna]
MVPPLLPLSTSTVPRVNFIYIYANQPSMLRFRTTVTCPLVLERRHLGTWELGLRETRGSTCTPFSFIYEI